MRLEGIRWFAWTAAVMAGATAVSEAAGARRGRLALALVAVVALSAARQGWKMLTARSEANMTWP